MPYARILSGIFMILTLVGVAACQQQTQSETPAKTAESPEIYTARSADSVEIRYDVYGSGDRTLLFVHCWCCNRGFWDAQVDEFAEEYQVVTLDLAGHGQSGDNRDNWTMAAYGQDVAAVANDLGLEHIILVGHSMGGPVAIEAARILGDRVVAIVGVDNLQNLEQQWSDEQITDLMSMFDTNFAAVTYNFVRGRMFPPSVDSSLAEMIALQMASAPPDIARQSFENIMRYDYATALADVHVPIRCINSDENPTNVEANRQIAESFAVEIMPNSGHFPHMVKPEMFNELLHHTIADFWPPESAH